MSDAGSCSGRRSVLAVVLFLMVLSALAFGQTSITTYHYNNYRTGWNSTEATLTPANVNTTSFGLLHTIPLDDQVDSQPLVVPGVNITAGSQQGIHDVVYVATENNTIYAVDEHSGTILLKPNFGAAVPYPTGCNNNGPRVGINSTPVIDLSSNTLYVTVYTLVSGTPTYYIHALDLGSLTDKVTPQMIVASNTLNDGTTFNFNATYQRQRPGLLLLNGTIYAGFGSFCDHSANLSRGWLLGWSAGTLTPLAANQLNNKLANAPNTFFLSSVWMSGYAPSADDAGNILFVTGNSDPSGTTYDGVTNIQESVVKITPDLGVILSIFTPSNQSLLDQSDADFGSGGVMVLPDQPGSVPHLAAAGGKWGTLFLMNADNLGGYSTTSNNVLGSYNLAGCWCGPSYFVDSDKIPRLVTSMGKVVKSWQVNTSPKAALKLSSTSPYIVDGQDPGFFTTVSSNGNSTPIIWALSRPLSASQTSIYLYAFDPDNVTNKKMKQLLKETAGTWPSFNGNANLVPVVANGQVYVAAYKQLRIFGLRETANANGQSKK